MALFKRNIVTSILLLPYFYGWYFSIDWFALGHAKSPNSCGAANGFLLVFQLLIVTVYALMMLINVILREGKSRLDYVKFLLIVIAPAFLLYLYLVFSSSNTPEVNLHEFK
jgi:hypothetical protein